MKLTFRKEHFKYIARFSFPLIPYALSGVILAQFDRIMINSILDSADDDLPEDDQQQQNQVPDKISGRTHPGTVELSRYF